jgi:hypothetical protein
VASEAGKAFSPRFCAQAAGYDELNPPPHDTVPDGAREAAAKLNKQLHPLNDELPADSAPPRQPAKVDCDTGGIPDFLDRRRTTGEGDICRPGDGRRSMKRIVLDLPPEQGHALAQFVKRTGFDDCQRLASRYDGGEEAEEMWEAIRKLQIALAEAGFAPR